MTNGNGNTARSPWLGVLWCALSLLPLMVAATLLLMAARHFNLWLYADQYVAAELEVKRFEPKPGDDGQGRLIEGVIHPGEEPVWTSDSDLAIRQFVSPADPTGRRVPLRREIEGKRLAVEHWPQHTKVARWWHPPTVVMPGATRQGGAVVCDALLGMAFVSLGLLCFRGGVRYLLMKSRTT